MGILQHAVPCMCHLSTTRAVKMHSQGAVQEVHLEGGWHIGNCHDFTCRHGIHCRKRVVKSVHLMQVKVCWYGSTQGEWTLLVVVYSLCQSRVSSSADDASSGGD